MSKENTDFLRFSAYSIKEYIIRKLSENPKFTDQVYEGSNLNTLIDLVSYMYQCMIYQLNGAAAESMWSDTQIYENISRLSKILGYSPRGIVPSSCTFYLDNMDDNGEPGKFENVKIPSYSYIDTGKTDTEGNPIRFSMPKGSTVQNGKIIGREYKYYDLTMYNGMWKLYSTIFTATGDDYETFVLDGLQSNSKLGKLVANRSIDVYIVRDRQDGTGDYDVDCEWQMIDDEIFTNNKLDFTSENYYGKIYSNNDKVFNLRLNENKTYEIKFGNGIIGRKLNKGDKLYIFYLDTNGEYGEIDANTIPSSGVNLCHSPSDFGISDRLYMKIFYTGLETVDKYVSDLNMTVLQTMPSSPSTEEEDVDDIRKNASIWFKTGRRLVTQDDFRYFILNLLNDSNIIDCKVQNVWEYTSTFYKWLYSIGLQKHNDETYYLNERKLVKYDYKYSDAADANNVYVWTKLYSQNIESVKKIVEQKIYQMKLLTSNVVLLDPIQLNFAITAAPTERVVDYIENYTVFDQLGESYVEVTIDDDILYVATEVQGIIEEKILDFFDVRKLRIGQKVNYNDLIQDIMSINGISNVRTVWRRKNDDGSIDYSTPPITRDGICFATWTQTMIEPADSVEIGNTSKTLEPFQFPSLYDSNVSNKIKIIKKSINSINKITY